VTSEERRFLRALAVEFEKWTPAHYRQETIDAARALLAVESEETPRAAFAPVVESPGPTYEEETPAPRKEWAVGSKTVDAISATSSTGSRPHERDFGKSCQCGAPDCPGNSRCPEIFECKCCGEKIEGDPWAGHFCSARCRDNYTAFARQHSEEASAPATSTEDLLISVCCRLDAATANNLVARRAVEDVREALRLYREERGLGEKREQWQYGTTQEHAARAKKLEAERDEARRERDENASEVMRLQGELSEARERIGKAAAFCRSFEGNSRYANMLLDILRGEGGGSKERG